MTRRVIYFVIFQTAAVASKCGKLRQRGPTMSVPLKPIAVYPASFVVSDVSGLDVYVSVASEGPLCSNFLFFIVLLSSTHLLPSTLSYLLHSLHFAFQLPLPPSFLVSFPLFPLTWSFANSLRVIQYFGAIFRVFPVDFCGARTSRALHRPGAISVTAALAGLSLTLPVNLR